MEAIVTLKDAGAAERSFILQKQAQANTKLQCVRFVCVFIMVYECT